jgi:arylsulfatase
MRTCAVLLLAALAAFPLAAAERSNIILVMTDDQGYGDLACHGNKIIQTPNLDAFYNEAARFTDFHVSPTCSPTRSALMTGRHEFKNGVTHTINERERLTPQAFTLAQLLQSVGYTTGIFGKWHLGDEAEYQPNRRGFDEVFIHGAGGIGQTYVGSCGDAPGNKYFDPAILHNGKFKKTKGYCTDVFFRQATRWIDEQRKRGRPFFAYITPNAPHGPLDVAPEYEAKYTGKVPPNVAKFYGMITNIDENFGRLMQQLTEWGLDKDTLVIFMTDNGTATGSQIYNAGMRGAKGSPWQGGTRVPALWRWPGGFTGGRDIRPLTAHIDIFPTIAEITGASVPTEFAMQVEGSSLLPLLKDENAAWTDRYFVTHVGRWEKGKAAEAHYAACSIRNSRFTLVNPVRQGEKWELFDLAADPGEMTNVIDRHPEVAKALKAELDRWWTEVTPLLVNEDAVGPAQNPFKVLYWQQFGGGPDGGEQSKAEPARKKG